MAISPVRDVSGAQRSNDMPPPALAERVYVLPASWPEPDSGDNDGADEVRADSDQDTPQGMTADRASAYQLLTPGLSTMQFAQWRNGESDQSTHAVLIQHSISTVEEISITPIELR